MGKTAVITCTGDRQQAFSLCREYHRRWVEPNDWIVIDGPGRSYDLNLLNAFLKLRPDTEQIVFMEDDDWYAPGYLGETLAALAEVKICGIRNDRRYNVHTPSWVEMGNMETASLASTAIKIELLPLLIDVLNSATGRFLDMALWQVAHEHDIPRALRDSSAFVSIKGMPGRAGLGYGHHGRLAHADPLFAKLGSWIGSDVENYRNIWTLTSSGETR